MLESEKVPTIVRDALLFIISPQPGDFLRTPNPEMLAALRQHRLAPALYLKIKGQDREGDFPPEFIRGLEADYALSLRQAILQEQGAHRVLRGLADSGVEPILLKGMDLRRRLYRDAEARPMSDLDLLIAPPQLPRAGRALENLGFSLYSRCSDPRPGYRDRFVNELLFNAPGASLSVDLHWEICSGAGYYRLSFQDLQKRAEVLDFKGVRLRVLAREHALIHLCLHIFEHFYGLVQVLDLALFLRRLTPHWPLFLAETINFNCRAPVYLVLSQLSRLIPLPVPPVILAALGHSRPDYLERLVLSKKLGYLTNYLAVIRHYSPRDWLRYLAAKLWPDPDYLLTVYGDARRSFYLSQFLAKLLDY